MTEEEVKEFERGMRQICSLDPVSGLNAALNVSISNQAILETMLATQAVIFSQIFPELTKEQHHANFKAKYEENKSEILIQMIKNDKGPVTPKGSVNPFKGLFKRGKGNE